VGPCAVSAQHHSEMGPNSEQGPGLWKARLPVINYIISAVRVIWLILAFPGAVCNQPVPHGYQMDANH
jgi:hypothetical protein